MAHRTTLEEERPAKTAKAAKKPAAGGLAKAASNEERERVFDAFRRWGYLGTKRFSLEGVTALIPLLDSILDTAGEHGALESIMAMSHRGRLNVMVHAACKTPHRSEE